MARTIQRLNTLSIKRLLETPTPVLRRTADGDGLYLQTDTDGYSSWIFMWKAGGRRRVMGLGSACTVTLASARRSARKAKTLVNAGDDPIEERKKKRVAVINFGAAAKECHAMLAPGWRSDKHRAHWLPMLEKYAKPLYGKPVNKIDTDDVVRVLTPLWHEQPDLARRLRERIQRVLNWTTAKGMRQGKNPAAWEGNLQDWMSKPVPMQVRTKHMRALPYDDIPAFMTRLRALDRLGARALEFTVLTAARTGETLGATWTEINFEQALWIVPGERMKMRLPHTVPLSERALQIVKDQHAIRSSQLVFRGLRDNRPLSNSAMLDVLEGLGVDVTVHGFRSSFSDWAGDKMAARFPCELVQLALAHAIGNTTDRAYRRTTALEQRRELMNAWATYCERPPETDNIIQMEYPFPPRMG